MGKVQVEHQCLSSGFRFKLWQLQQQMIQSVCELSNSRWSNAQCALSENQMWQLFCTYKRCHTATWSGATHTAQFWDQQPFLFHSGHCALHMFSILMSQCNVCECWDGLYQLQLHQMERLSAVLLASSTEVSPVDGVSTFESLSLCQKQWTLWTTGHIGQICS